MIEVMNNVSLFLRRMIKYVIEYFYREFSFNNIFYIETVPIWVTLNNKKII